MRRRLFAAALTALLLMMTASVCAAQEALGEDGLYAETPALLRLRQETVSETAEDGVTLRRTYPSTANALVDAQMRALAKQTAARRGIPAQDKRAVAGGTDAGPIHTACGGVPCLVMAAPCRYIHSPASLCRLSDIDALGALTLALLEEVGKQ